LGLERIEGDVFGPFSAGDSFWLYRLQRRGISLNPQRGLTQPHVPLWEAWLAFLTQQAMGQPTYVLYDARDGQAFVQVEYRPHQAAADVTFLAPSLLEDRQATAAWLRLLDGACIEAAGRGIQRVFANVPESGPEADAFHQAGFTLYAGEDIYRLDLPQAGLAEQDESAALALRLQRPEDWPAIQKLCVAVTPQRVRQTEGGIGVTTSRARHCQSYVLPASNGEDLVATLTICTGRLAHWLRLLVHPGHTIDGHPVEPAEALLRWGVAALNRRPPKPVYCSVRQYESGVRSGLKAVGFAPHTARALTVRHTVAWIKTPAQELAAALAGSAEPVPPAYRINGEPEFNTSNGQLAARHDA
jgi:hypothetical protein